MPSIDSQTLKDFNGSRHIRNVREICHAPFVNMYFNSYGQVGACWLTLEKGPRYPDLSLREIWFGEYFTQLRENIRQKNLGTHCSVCEKRITDRVFSNVLAQAYDLEDDFGKYPTIMEFELSNLCNLACIMCKGTLSSKIRKDREKLPPMKSPYGDRFVEELVEFLPHLKEARFNGGEPFLQPICWKIWERISEINPNIVITAATNGTLLTEKMKKVMEKCRFRINVSLDSLNKKTYESIRLGSNFEKVLEHISFYKDYCERKNTILSIMVNPMRNNWKELPKFVRWCSENNLHLWFNTIWRPRHLAIWTMPVADLKKISDQLSDVEFKRPAGTIEAIFVHNVNVYRNFVHNQLQGWIRDQEGREASFTDYASLMKSHQGSKKKFTQKEIFKINRSLFVKLEEKTRQVFSKETLYHHLLEQSDHSLEQNLIKPEFDHSLEWIYKVCDYY